MYCLLRIKQNVLLEISNTVNKCLPYVTNAQNLASFLSISIPKRQGCKIMMNLHVAKNIMHFIHLSHLISWYYKDSKLKAKKEKKVKKMFNRRYQQKKVTTNFKLCLQKLEPFQMSYVKEQELYKNLDIYLYIGYIKYKFELLVSIC